MNGPAPNPARLAELQKSLAQSWKPVKAVPSVAFSAAMLVLIVLALTIAIPLLIGTGGFHALKPGQMAAYYGLITAITLLFAPIVVRRFRPGVAIRTNAGLVSLAATVLLIVLACLLFPSLNIQHFSAGVRCLIVGTVSGAIASIGFSFVLGQGLAINPVKAATATGFFAGVCGMFVLAVNCPVLESPHILGWHVTVLLVTSAGGAAMGWILARVR